MSAIMPSLVPWIDLLGRSLLHFFWQGMLIGLLYWVLRMLCIGVAARYRLGMGALLSMLVCPLATFVWLLSSADPSGSAAPSSLPNAPVAELLIVSVSQSTSASFWQAALMNALPWCVALWLVGVCLIATRSFLHWKRLSRVVRESVALPREWQLRLFQLRERFGILRPVRLMASVNIATPTLIGWLKPVILLPASLLSGFSPAQIELIIAHELSHVRRFDYLANLAQVAIETLLFYHPVVHWISSDVRQARESCCDDLVLTLGGGERIAYARTLADLEELQHDFGHAMPALGAGGGVLLTRIRRIVDPMHALSIEPLPRSNGLTLPLLLAFVGISLISLRMHLLPLTTLAVILPTPSESVALLSDNPQFAQAPSRAVAATAAAPVSGSVGSAVDAQNKIARASEPLAVSVDRLSRPHVTLSTVSAKVADASRIANLGAQITLPALAVADSSRTTDVAGSTDAIAAAGGMAVPVLEQTVAALYPLGAQQDGTTGKVDLDFRIGADGSVRDIRVLHAQPSGVFEQAAISALRQWHFSIPAQSNLTARYSRSFVFTHSSRSNAPCREVTGSHICRNGNLESDSN